MKRVLSLVLAVIMTMSMASVAFAATLPNAGDGLLEMTNEYYVYDSDLGYLIPLRQAGRDYYKPGETIYIRLVNTGKLSTTQINKYRVYGNWLTGSSYIDTSNMSIVYRKSGLSSSSNYYTVNFTYKNESYSFDTTTNPSGNQNAMRSLALKAIQESGLKYSGLLAAQKELYTVKTAGYAYNNKYYKDEAALIDGGIVSKATSGFYNTSTGKYYAEKEDAVDDSSIEKITNTNPRYVVAGVDPSASLTVYTKTNALTLAGANAMQSVNAGVGYTSNNIYFTAEGAVSDYSGGQIVGVGQSTTVIYVEDDKVDNTEFKSTAENEYQTPVYSAYTIDGKWYKVDGSTTLRQTLNSLGYASNQAGYYDSSDNNKFYTESDLIDTVVTGYCSGTTYYPGVDAAFDSLINIQPASGNYIIGGNHYANLTDTGTGITPVAVGSFYNPDNGNAIISATNIDSVVKSKVDGDISTYLTTITLSGSRSSSTTNYEYFVAIPIKSSSTTRSLDVVGDVGVATSQSKFKNYDDPFQMTVTIEHTKVDGDSGSITVGSDDAVVSFASDAGEVDIEFGNNGELALYVVNASGQSNINLKYSTSFNADFANEHSYANLDFLSWVYSPMFNRNGTLYIYADRDTYLYEITSDGFKKVDATYDRSYDAWRFTTRKLGAYVISDRELKETVTSSSTAPSESSSGGTGTGSSGGGTTSGGSSGDGNKYNPNTGRCA